MASKHKGIYPHGPDATSTGSEAGSRQGDRNIHMVGVIVNNGCVSTLESIVFLASTLILIRGCWKGWMQLFDKTSYGLLHDMSQCCGDARGITNKK